MSNTLSDANKGRHVNVTAIRYRCFNNNQLAVYAGYPLSALPPPSPLQKINKMRQQTQHDSRNRGRHVNVYVGFISTSQHVINDKPVDFFQPPPPPHHPAPHPLQNTHTHTHTNTHTHTHTHTHQKTAFTAKLLLRWIFLEADKTVLNEG